jgi:hypothetical protein
MSRSLARLLLLLCLGGAATGCAHKPLVLDLYGSIVYEKPQIVAVTHVVRDPRAEEGGAVVRVTIQGDPGLTASFDIYPGIVDRRPMRETAAGSYEGEFEFPRDTLGGTFTITGRLEHPDAGEVLGRDQTPLIIRRVGIP